MIQYFIVYRLGDGGYLNIVLIICSDLEKDSDQKLTVLTSIDDVGLCLFRKLSFNPQIDTFYVTVKSGFITDWRFQRQLQFSFITLIIVG